MHEHLVVLKEICSQEGNEYRSNLEVPRIYLGVSATGETKRDNARATTHHWSPVSCKEMHSVVGGRLWSREHQNQSSGVNEELSVRQNIPKEQQRRAANFIWN